MDKEHWLNETIGFLALASIKGVGFWTMYKIADSKMGFKDLLKANSASDLEQFLRVTLPHGGDWDSYQKELWSKGLSEARRLAHQGITLLFSQQEYFPKLFNEIPDPPRWIFVRGNHGNLHKRSIAVVGSRKPSEDGIFLTRYIIASMSGTGLVSISGLASGIDQVAHKESIRFNVPTVAVLGNGIDVEYPKGSSEISNDIVSSGGTIITEYLPDQTGNAESFVRRNRLQSALSSVVVPVEWKIKSGTAHTVDYANKHGKAILNLFLPNTYLHRDEIRFSEQKYGAFSCEVPKDTQKMLEILEGYAPVEPPAVQTSLNL